MKAFALVVVVALVFTPLLYAQEVAKTDAAKPATVSSDLPFQRATVEQTEMSLKKALESKSPGLQISAALTVREMKMLKPKESLSSLVIPLMALVKDDANDESVRVIAAMALHDLKSAKGNYAISQLAQDAAHPNLQKMCQWLAYYTLQEKRPEYATEEVK